MIGWEKNQWKNCSSSSYAETTILTLILTKQWATSSLKNILPNVWLRMRTRRPCLLQIMKLGRFGSNLFQVPWINVIFNTFQILGNGKMNVGRWVWVWTAEKINLLPNASGTSPRRRWTNDHQKVSGISQRIIIFISNFTVNYCVQFWSVVCPVFKFFIIAVLIAVASSHSSDPFLYRAASSSSCLLYFSSRTVKFLAEVQMNSN